MEWERLTPCGWKESEPSREANWVVPIGLWITVCCIFPAAFLNCPCSGSPFKEPLGRDKGKGCLFVWFSWVYNWTMLLFFLFILNRFYYINIAQFVWSMQVTRLEMVLVISLGECNRMGAGDHELEWEKRSLASDLIPLCLVDCYQMITSVSSLIEAETEC